MEKLTEKFEYASDEQVVTKVVKGETALFEVLVRRYNSLLYKIARSYGFGHHDTEDLMQETHFVAYTQLQTFRNDSSYKTWLTKIHLNKCYHSLNYGHFKYEKTGNGLITDETPIMHTSSDKQQTERVVVNKELARVLEENLGQLPLIYRTVFLLREIEQFSVAETAALLEITPTNVKVRLNRAKVLLQKRLESYYTGADIYEFRDKFCDEIVIRVFQRISVDGS